MTRTIPRTTREEIAWLRWRCRISLALAQSATGDPSGATFVIVADAARRRRLSAIIGGVQGLCLEVDDRCGCGAEIARIEVLATAVEIALNAYEAAQGDAPPDPEPEPEAA